MLKVLTPWKKVEGTYIREGMKCFVRPAVYLYAVSWCRFRFDVQGGLSREDGMWEFILPIPKTIGLYRKQLDTVCRGQGYYLL